MNIRVALALFLAGCSLDGAVDPLLSGMPIQPHQSDLAVQGASDLGSSSLIDMAASNSDGGGKGLCLRRPSIRYSDGMVTEGWPQMPLLDTCGGFFCVLVVQPGSMRGFCEPYAINLVYLNATCSGDEYAIVPTAEHGFGVVSPLDGTSLKYLTGRGDWRTMGAAVARPTSLFEYDAAGRCASRLDPGISTDGFYRSAAAMAPASSVATGKVVW